MTPLTSIVITNITSYEPKRENRLIATLKDIDMRRGIANTKALLGNPEVREDFRRSMRELVNIRINPVTIPEKYGIGHIPNLLDTYYNKLAEEHDKNVKLICVQRYSTTFLTRRAINCLGGRYLVKSTSVISYIAVYHKLKNSVANLKVSFTVLQLMIDYSI